MEFSILPLELQTNTIVHLDIRDLVTCARVCQLWNAICDSDDIWSFQCKIRGWKLDREEQHETSKWKAVFIKKYQELKAVHCIAEKSTKLLLLANGMISDPNVVYGWKQVDYSRVHEALSHIDVCPLETTNGESLMCCKYTKQVAIPIEFVVNLIMDLRNRLCWDCYINYARNVHDFVDYHKELNECFMKIQGVNTCIQKVDIVNMGWQNFDLYAVRTQLQLSDGSIAIAEGSPDWPVSAFDTEERCWHIIDSQRVVALPKDELSKFQRFLFGVQGSGWILKPGPDKTTVVEYIVQVEKVSFIDINFSFCVFRAVSVLNMEAYYATKCHKNIFTVTSVIPDDDDIL